MFVPHCESRDRSLSGSSAILVVQYDLLSVLGAPIERQMVQVGLLRIYEAGYVICPLPPPSFNDGVEGFVGAQISDGDRCKPQGKDLNCIYILQRKQSFKDETDATATAFAGGVAYESGQWRRVYAAPLTREVELRPPRGFFRD